MSVFTKFLKLIKPQNYEYYNVEHFNHNSELIDKKMEEHDTALTTIQQGATNSQKGIVQFGIEEGKALEGNMLARLAGAYGFGGDIQNPGVKNQNYIYYDNNTRKMYKCLNQNSDTSANVQNYVPIDNFSFLERLENLLTFKTFHLSYNNGNLIPNGTRINMPSFINSDNLVNYLIIVRTRDDIRYYISIDGSAAIRQCNFNGIKLKYYGSNNILEVVDNAGILMYLAGTKFLTAI